MTILVIFWNIFGDRMANLGLIDIKIGLYIKLMLMKGKTNLKLIPNNLTKMP